MRVGRVCREIGLLAAVLAVGGCTSSFFPTSGPESWDIRAGQRDPTSLPYALVRLTPRTVDILAQFQPRLAGVWPDRSPPKELRFGIGDIVSVTIFEAAAGGLFIPIEAGVRPGNFISLPNQNVDTKGNISVPYAGTIRADGRTPVEVQAEIVDKLRNRAIEPQAVVTLITQNTSLISVLGEVNAPARFPAMAAGEHILDAITRAGGPRSQGYDIWVMIERNKRRAVAPFGALVYEPANNIWAHPGDTIYLYKEPQTFLAFGAFTVGGGSTSPTQSQISFDQWRLSLAEGVAKAGGLVDTLADAASIFLYRGEVREVAERLGIDCSPFEGPIIPVIYEVNFRDPAGYFLATKFQLRNKDVLFAANAGAIETAKIMNYVRLVTATVNDPIVAANNAVILRNNIRLAP
jgi:polysaccharide export outer membrane protein